MSLSTSAAGKRSRVTEVFPCSKDTRFSPVWSKGLHNLLGVVHTWCPGTGAKLCVVQTSVPSFECVFTFGAQCQGFVGKVLGHSLKSCADLCPCPIQCPGTRSPPCTRARAPCPIVYSVTYKTLCSHWCPSGTVPGYSVRVPSVNDALN